MTQKEYKRHYQTTTYGSATVLAENENEAREKFDDQDCNMEDYDGDSPSWDDDIECISDDEEDTTPIPIPNQDAGRRK